MNRNRSASVCVFLLLVVVLFCLSVLAPREWSSWDAEPVGPSVAARPSVPMAAGELLSARDALMPCDGSPGADKWCRRAGPDTCLAEADASCGGSSSTAILPAGMSDPCSTAGRECAILESGATWAGASQPVFETLSLDSDVRADHVGFADTTAARRNGAPAWRGQPELSTVAVEIEAAVKPGSSPVWSEGLPPKSLASQTPSLLPGPPAPEPFSRPAGRRATAGQSVLSSPWPTPLALVEQLDELALLVSCRDWCVSVQQRLKQLTAMESLAAVDVKAVLADLQSLAAEGQQRAQAHPDPQIRFQWGCAALAIKRRTDIWEQVHAIASRGSLPLVPDDAAPSLRRAYDWLAACLRSVSTGEVWWSYLLMDEAERQLFGEAARDSVECRNLAKQFMLRVDPAMLTPSQQEFLQQPACVAYLRQVRRLATEPVDYACLLAELECYELERSIPSGLHVATAQQVLRWTDDEAIAELGRRLDTNYRNANVRIVIGRSFMQRLLPSPEPTSERVDEIIQGAHTTGCSETLTELGVCLIPSPDSWRIGLVAQGQIATATRSSSGPATFHSRGSSVFEAAKEVVIHRHGSFHRATVADARTSNELARVSTRLDPLPIVGDLARAIAVERYRGESPAARREVRHRVASTASERIDAEVACRLDQVQQQFLDHFYQPLQKLALNPVTTDMVTTETDLVARLRLAGHHQLAAHTPRPATRAGGVFHLQAHESAVNNLFEQLNWEGRRANVRELYREIAELFQLTRAELPEDLPDDVFVRFADAAPLRIAFQQGRATLQLMLAELSHGSNRWRDFTVRVHYRHAYDRPDADLVRDQYVELIGRRLHLRDQVALRGIFSRVFSQSKPIQLVSEGLRNDPRMAGVQVEQLVLSDGWLSVSLGDVAPDGEQYIAQTAATSQDAAFSAGAPTGNAPAGPVVVRIRSP